MSSFFLAIDLSGCVVVGPRDADLEHRIIKAQPHEWPNLRLVIFETLPDIISRHIEMFRAL